MSEAVVAPAEEQDPLDLLAVKSLAGDTRDWILDRLKNDHSALPWNIRPEAEQARTIEQADVHARALVRRIWDIVMSLDRPTVVGKLVQAKIKGEKVAFEFQMDRKDVLRHAASDAVGKEVLLVLAESDLVMGDRGAPKPSADQGALFPDNGDGGDDGDEGPVFDNTPSGKG